MLRRKCKDSFQLSDFSFKLKRKKEIPAQCAGLGSVSRYQLTHGLEHREEIGHHDSCEYHHPTQPPPPLNERQRDLGLDFLAITFRPFLAHSQRQRAEDKADDERDHHQDENLREVVGGGKRGKEQVVHLLSPSVVGRYPGLAVINNSTYW